MLVHFNLKVWQSLVLSKVTGFKEIADSVGQLYVCLILNYMVKKAFGQIIWYVSFTDFIHM